MRSSAVLAVAVLAATPALSAPSAPFRRSSSSGSGTPVGANAASGAIDINAIGNITQLALPIIDKIIDHFKNKGSTATTATANTTAATGTPQTREFVPLITRDNSGAIDLGSIANITEEAIPIIKELIDKFTDASGSSSSSSLHANSSQPATREVADLYTRVDEEEVEDVEKAAKFTLDDAKNIASIGSSVVSVIHNIFSGSSSSSSSSQTPPNSRRELEAFFARDDAGTADQSGALKLSDIANIALTAGGLLGDIFKRHEAVYHPQARELEELFARQTSTTDVSGALKLSDIASIALTAGSLLGDIFKRHEGVHHPQARELEELFARQASTTDVSGALKLSDIASIALTAGGLLGDIFKRHEGLEDLLARDDTDADVSGALKFSDIANIALTAGGLLGDIFKRTDDQSAALALLLGPNGLFANRPTHPGTIAEPSVHIARDSLGDQSIALKLLGLQGLAPPNKPLGVAFRQEAARSLNDLD